MNVWRGDFLISTDPARLDLDVIHGFLERSYWAKAISRELVARSIRHSLWATYAYLADVFVLESHRARGLASWLMETILGHPELQGLRRWSLVTRDAHSLYRKVGFGGLAHPERHMEKSKPGIYAQEVL